jgi:hypothetical protein
VSRSRPERASCRLREESIDERSRELLARGRVTERAAVRHLLLAWDELAPTYRGALHPRAAGRSREEADALALQLLAEVRGGEPMERMVSAHSEDSGEVLVVTPNSRFVAPFKALSLRLEVGEAGLVRTAFGWHVIERVE